MGRSNTLVELGYTAGQSLAFKRFSVRSISSGNREENVRRVEFPISIEFDALAVYIVIIVTIRLQLLAIQSLDPRFLLYTNKGGYR